MTSESSTQSAHGRTKVIGIGPAGSALVRRMQAWGLPHAGTIGFGQGAKDTLPRSIRTAAYNNRISNELDGADSVYLVVGSSWAGAHHLVVTATRMARARGIRVCVLGPHITDQRLDRYVLQDTISQLRACAAFVHRVPNQGSTEAARYPYGTAGFASAVEQCVWRLLSPLMNEPPVLAAAS